MRGGGGDIAAVGGVPDAAGAAGLARGLRVNFILPELNLSGGIKANRLFAHELARLGHDVRIVYPRLERPWPRPWRVRSFVARVQETWQTHGKDEHHELQTLAREISVPGDVVLAKDVPDADVTIGTWWKTMEWVHEYPPCKGLQAHFIHGFETFGGQPARVEEVYHLRSEKIAVSSWLAGIMREKFGARDVEVVHNGLERGRFDGSPRARGSPAVVGMVYNSVAIKAPDIGFEVLRRVRERLPGVRAVCFASTPLLAEHRLPAGVEFLLRPSQREIPSLYRKADCWLVPSRSEGFGLPGLEAMGSGCPVVSTRCGGPSDYMRDGENGFEVAIDDADEMTRRVVEVLTMPPSSWRAMSAACVATAARFEWEASGRALEGALVRCLMRGGYTLRASEGGPPRVVEPPRRRALRVNIVLPLPSLSGGVKSNRLIAEGLVRRGHDVRIVFPDGRVPFPPVWKVRRFARRLRSEAAVWGKPRHHLVRSTAAITRVLGTSVVPGSAVPDGDIVIATWWETMEWIAGYPKSKGLHAYFIRHHELFGGDPARVRRTYLRPARKLVIARWLAEVMAREYGDSGAALIPNGVDRKQFNALPRERGVVPTVGFMYGPMAWKGAGTAIGAMQRVQERVPGVRVVIFSSDPMMAEHRSLLRNVDFRLRPHQSEIAAMYRSCDVWVVPSTSEGFGMPGLEAAACRCPIVSTRCGGPEDYVEDGVSGYLVPVGDGGAMAAAVLRVLGSSREEWRAMSDASHTISRRFDWDSSAEKLEAVLLGMLAEDGGTRRET